VPRPRSSPASRARRRLILPLLALVAAAAAILVVVLAPGSGAAPRKLESIFQDDQRLIDSPTPIVVRTLDTLASLGVDRIRVTVVWWALAPGHDSPRRPARFNAADPAAYPPGAWAPYDRLVELARERGIAVDFNLTAPGPLWAMAPGAPNARAADHYRPAARDFGQFVLAIGRRYSGSYPAPPGAGVPAPTGVRSPHLPRVGFWTIWNEPNQPGWLQPQWRTVGGLWIADSPRLYRLYVDAAFAALQRAGHAPSTDTILIGELAPEGIEGTAAADPIPPMPFIRALYCVDAGYSPLRGSQAAALHCPQNGSTAAFASAHPGLFDATGFAHHPYSFFLAPNAPLPDPNFVPLADLSRLEGGLDRIFATYGVGRQLPIYLTEYGYETNPPNPFQVVTPRQQSLYLNQAQYMAWKDPRVRSLAQFLLYDSAPNPAYRPGSHKYWSTFQTGLLYLSGARKPSFNAYRLPIYVPSPAFHGGDSVAIWGMLRLAPNDIAQRARIQWRPAHGGGYRDVATVSTSDPSGFLTADVQLPGSGAVRIAWVSPGGEVFHSRSVGVRSG
jgi:hypothetical protein